LIWPADQVDILGLALGTRLASNSLDPPSLRLRNSEPFHSADSPGLYVARVTFTESPFTVGIQRTTILALILLIIVRVVVIPVVIVVIVVVVVVVHIVVAMVAMAIPPVPLVPVVDTVRGETGSVSKSRASDKSSACRHPQLFLAVP